MCIFGKARGFLLAVAWLPLQGTDWAGAEDFHYSFLADHFWVPQIQQHGQGEFVVSDGQLNFEIPATGQHTAILPWKHTLPTAEVWYVEAHVSVPGTNTGDLLSSGILITSNTSPQYGADGIVMRVENLVENDTLSRRLVFEEVASGQILTYYDQTKVTGETSVRLKFQYYQEANLALYCFEDSPGFWLCVAAKPPLWNLEVGEGLRVAAFAAANLTQGIEGKVSIDDFYVYRDESDKDSDGISAEQETNLGTNPYSADTDKDGLTDSEEIHTYLTNPLLADTDEDSFWDGLEIQGGGNPLKSTSLPSLISPSFEVGTHARSLQIQTFPGLTYQIQYSSNLVDWINLGDSIFGSGESQSMDLGISQDAVDFYRILITD